MTAVEAETNGAAFESGVPQQLFEAPVNNGWDVTPDAGQERVVWNPALTLPAKEFEFNDTEVARIKAALQTWDSYDVNADRRWLEPLVGALFGGALQ